MSTDQKEYSFTDADETDLIQYRAISKGAISAVLFALASPLVMVHWLLGIVPLTAVVVSWLALRGIARSETVVGRKAALFAMGLSLFVTAWSISRDISRRNELVQAAEEHARHWLNLVLGAKDDLDRLHEAHQLHERPAARLPKGTRLHNYLGTLEPPANDSEESQEGEHFREFFSEEPLKTIIALGSDAKFRFDETLDIERADLAEVVWLQFTVIYADDAGAPQERKIVVQASRDYDEARKEARWWVKEIGDRGRYFDH